jgi:uncharacterized membrane protein YfcA
LRELALVLAGAASGWINILAGGGSYLTMALLMNLGLDATLSNGTIRPGILSQNLLAVGVFRKHQMLSWKVVLKWSVPVLLGALIGSKLAADAPPEVFRRWLGPLVLVGCWPLLREFRAPAQEGPALTGKGAWFYFLVGGFYGGLVQAGVGFILLGAARHAGLDLRQGNALKVALTLVLGLPSLLIFMHSGRVDWPSALWLALGTCIGSYFGADWVARRSLRWIKAFLLVGLLLFALQLLVT